MNNQELKKLAEALTADLQTIVSTMRQVEAKRNKPSEGGKSKNGDDRSQIVAKASAASGSSPIMIEVLYDSYIGKNYDAQTANKLSVADVRDWLLSKNLKADNQLIHLILKSISESIYTGRPLTDVMEQLIEQMFDEVWSDQILDAITAQLEDCL